MKPNSIRNRFLNPCFRRIALILLLCLPVSACWSQDNPQEDLTPGRLFVPAPRELVRPVTRARKAMESGDYREAVELLGLVLTSSAHGDYLQPLEEDPLRSVSIHNQAHELMGQIPRAERQDYELRYKVTARQMLDEAVGNADFALMARVSRHFFYTEAGYHATMLLGHHYLEMGQPVSAISCFSALIKDADARKIYDPEASVLLAACWLLTGNEAQAQIILDDLAATNPAATIRLPEETRSLFENPENAIAWLKELVGTTSLVGFRAVDDWLMYRGNAERNAASGTGFPLAYPRWFVPAINEPIHELTAQQLFHQRLSGGRSLIPALQPIAVADTVIVRSLDQITGIDFRTGKRIWEFPAWDRNSLLDEDLQAEQLRQRQTESWHIEQRIWRDHLYGQVASNGRHVFVIDQPGYAAPANQRSVVGRGVIVGNPTGGRETNELKAIDVVRQGAFCWEVGGPSGGRVPELAGVFFLGAPLVLDNELYILGEIGGEIRLIVLQQDTGEMVWSQQVAAIDTVPPVTGDRIRRLAGATPSCSNGIIVCPTSATGMVAIERSTRSLLWGVQYPGLAWRGNSNAARVRFNRIRSLSDENMNSVDSTVTLVDGRVVIMPVESNRVYCYDLLTGKSLWNTQQEGDLSPLPGRDAGDALYVACVHQGVVVLVGPDKVTGLDIVSGDSRWERELESSGHPTGRGFLSGNDYFLPTSESMILRLDVVHGTVVDRVPTQRVLGNLVCYKGDLISQGHDVVSIYPQAQPVREYVARVIEETADPNQLPPQVLRLQAQLQSQDGMQAEAVATADVAYQLTGKPAEKRLVLDLVLDLMESDYSQVQTYVRKYAADLEQYGRLKFVTALFAGLMNEGEYEQALAALGRSDLYTRKPTTLESADQFRTLDNGALRMRLDTWLRQQLMQATTDRNQTGFERALEDWTRRFASEIDPSGLEPFVQLVGPQHVPVADLLRLARWQLQGKQHSRADRVLRSLLERPETGPAERATALALHCRILLDSDWTERGLASVRELAEGFAEVSFADPWTGRLVTGDQFATSTLADRERPTLADWDSWRYGRVESRLESLRANRNFMMRTLAYPELLAATGDGPQHIQLSANIQDATLIIRDSLGNKLGELPYREDPNSRTYYSPRIYNGTYAIQDNLVIFNYAYDLMVVDLNRLKQGRKAVLWRKSLHEDTGVDARLNVRSAIQPKPVRNPWIANQVIITDRDGISTVGNFAANSRQVFYRIGRSIFAVDIFSGELLWQRSDLAPAGWMVAGEESLAVLENENASAIQGVYNKANLLNARTGTMRRTVDLSEFQEQTLWHHHGLKLLFTTWNREQSLTLFDLESEETVWNRSWPDKSLGVIRDPETLVLMTRAGDMEYVDVQTGEVQLALQADAQKCRSVHVMKLRDHDLILLNRDLPNPGVRPSDENVTIRAGMAGQAELFNGWVYCVDRQRGQLAWPDPARVEYFSIPWDHPVDSPVLTLNRVVYPGMDSGRGSNNSVELYTLDLRDGRLADIRLIRNWTLRTMEIQALPDRQSVVCHFNDRKLTLILNTDQDAPPAAPAALTNRFTLPKSKAFAAGDLRANRLETKQQELIRSLERKQDE